MEGKMAGLKMGFTSWGIRPWWNAVKWWWPRDRRKAVRVMMCSAIPAAWFSLRYGGWEATKADHIEAE